MDIDVTCVGPVGTGTYVEKAKIEFTKIGALKEIRITDDAGWTTIIAVDQELIKNIRWMLRDSRD